MALKIDKTSECTDGTGPRTHLYTIDEMTVLLEKNGCKILEIAGTPAFSDTFDNSVYAKDKNKWAKLKNLEMSLCTKPELLGISHHLLFVARKVS